NLPCDKGFPRRFPPGNGASWRRRAMRSVHRFLPALVLTSGLALGIEASACPNCKEAVAAQDEVAERGGQPTTFMKNGYNYSVLFMMAMPFGLLGTGAFLVSRAVKRGAFPEM